jgi:hypothetical protein
VGDPGSIPQSHGLNGTLRFQNQTLAQRRQVLCLGTHSLWMPQPLCKAPATSARVFSQRLGTDGRSCHPRKPNIFPGYPVNLLTSWSHKHRVKSPPSMADGRTRHQDTEAQVRPGEGLGAWEDTGGEPGRPGLCYSQGAWPENLGSPTTHTLWALWSQFSHLRNGHHEPKAETAPSWDLGVCRSPVAFLTCDLGSAQWEWTLSQGHQQITTSSFYQRALLSLILS